MFELSMTYDAKVSIHALVRVRHGTGIERRKENSFNPRTRESATILQGVVMDVKPVSIHALVRVRQSRQGQRRGSGCFNPRTRESATAWTPMA